MTRDQALNWMYEQNGQSLDFDGRYGAQCFDYFNYYYQFLTGRNPYSDGYAVEGAKDIWNVPTDLFTKIPNDPYAADQLPQTGDILIYNGSWGGGYGHVEMVLSADQNGVNVSAQNSKGPYVAEEFRPWNRVVGGLIGWLSYNGFNELTSPQPEPTPTPQSTPDPVPVPEPTPTPAPQPVLTPEPAPVPDPDMVVEPTNPVPTPVPVEPVPTPQPLFNLKKLLVKAAVTFGEAFAAAAPFVDGVHKLALAGAIGAGLSAAWNLVIWPWLGEFLNKESK